jgi:NifU-like protein involved in Fe-S cluster formation
MQKCHVIVSSNSNSSVKSKFPAASRSVNADLKRSWGQQYSPDCGCVVRFETMVDPRTQRIFEAKYHSKALITTIDKDNGGRLAPVYTTRTRQPMFQKCKCDTVHALSKLVTSYLPNKRMDQIRGMNEFTFTRSSLAFRHAVLAENNLPRHHTHCFDVVEDAFTGVVNNTIPARRIVDANYQIMLRAEYREEPVVVRSINRGRVEDGSTNKQEKEYFHPRSPVASLGADRNRLSMSSPRTMTTLRMFDINAEYWDEEEHARESAKQSSQYRFDWVSYVDEQYESKKSA